MYELTIKKYEKQQFLGKNNILESLLEVTVYVQRENFSTFIFFR